MNSNRKKMLILTSIYPFGSADNFVQKEIEVLNSQYEIDVLPQHRFQKGEIEKGRRIDLFSYSQGLYSEECKKYFLESIFYSLLSVPFSFRLLINFIFESLYIFSCLIKTILVKLVLRRPYSYKVKHKVFDLFTTTRILLILNFLTRKLDFSNYNLIYAYWSHELALLLALRSPKMKIIARLHGYDLYHIRRKSGYFPYRKYYIKTIHKAYFVSEDGRDYIARHYSNYDSKKLETLYLGARNCSKQKVHRRNEDTLRIITISSFNPVKQLKRLAEVIDEIPIPVQWDHLGGDIEKIPQTLLKVKDKNPSAIKFHGHIENDQLISTILKIQPDLFINCSASEGLPVSLLEAMSTGLPIIAPKIGGILEAVTSDENGYLLSHDFTNSELNLTIQRFYYTKNIRRNYFSEMSFKKWDEKFNEVSCLARFINSIQSLD